MGPKQIVVLLPNKPGSFSDLSALLGANSINVKAININIRQDLGEISIVVVNHEKAMSVLKGNGYDATETQVLAAYAPDHPGGLNAVVKPLKSAQVNIEKLYLSVAKKDEHPLIIMQVDDYDKATATLKANYVDLIEGEIKF